MSWKDRHQMMSEARSAVHDTFKIPVMFSSDNGASWRVVFCRLHEKVTPEGQTVGRMGAQMNVDTDSPKAIFVHADVPELKSGSLISVSQGVAYKVHQAAPQDRLGYRTAQLKGHHQSDGFPVPDWDLL